MAWRNAETKPAGIEDYIAVLDEALDALGGRANLIVLIEPENEFRKQFELLAHLDDAAHVARYRAFEDWHKHTQDIPGPLYLWAVEHLFRDNS